MNRTYCVKFKRGAALEMGQPHRYITAYDIDTLDKDYAFVDGSGHALAVIAREHVASVAVEGPAEFYAQMELCDALRALREGRPERERLCLTRWADIIENNLVDDVPLATRELSIDQKRLERSPLTEAVVEADRGLRADPPAELAQSALKLADPPTTPGRVLDEGMKDVGLTDDAGQQV